MSLLPKWESIVSLALPRLPTVSVPPRLRAPLVVEDWLPLEVEHASSRASSPPAPATVPAAARLPDMNDRRSSGRFRMSSIGPPPPFSPGDCRALGGREAEEPDDVLVSHLERGRLVGDGAQVLPGLG